MRTLHDVSIIIPWRDNGDANRQANLARVLDHLTQTELPIVLASDRREDGQPFNRSAAYNYGISLAPSNVYIFHEADMLINLYHLGKAIGEAETGLGLVVPFTEYRYMSEEDSRQIIAGSEPTEFEPEWVMGNGRSIGAVNVVSAESMRWVGQWDEQLSGHGFDDNAMHRAFEVACGPTRYVDGPGVHLWHPMAYAPWERGTDAARPENFTAEDVEATWENKKRLRLYQRATTPEQIRELTGAPW